MNDDFKRGDAVIVDWPDERNGYRGPAKFVQHLKRGQKYGMFDDYLDEGPQCLVKIKGASSDACFPLSSVSRA